MPGMAFNPFFDKGEKLFDRKGEKLFDRKVCLTNRSKVRL
jgi:hypothetical protein